MSLYGVRLILFEIQVVDILSHTFGNELDTLR